MTPSARAPWCRRPRIEFDRGRLLAAEKDNDAGHGDGDQGHGQRQIDVERKPQRDADQARLSHRLAEVGHALPDDEAAERGSDHGETDASHQGAQKKGSITRRFLRVVFSGVSRAGPTSGGAGEVVSVVVMVVVDGERASCFGPEQARVLGMLGHRLGDARAADVAVEADTRSLVRHDDVQVVRTSSTPKPRCVAQPRDQGRKARPRQRNRRRARARRAQADSGSLRSARASTTRCSSPPESCDSWRLADVGGADFGQVRAGCRHPWDGSPPSVRKRSTVIGMASSTSKRCGT